MKNRISIFLSCILLGSTLFISSCEKTNDELDVDNREKFLGVWRASSTGPGGDVNFNMNITASNSDPSEILMENFDALGSGTYVAGSITGNSISIPRNLVHSDTIVGEGQYLSDKTLSFTYEVRDGQTVENRSATARK